MALVKQNSKIINIFIRQTFSHKSTTQLKSSVKNIYVHKCKMSTFLFFVKNKTQKCQ